MAKVLIAEEDEKYCELMRDIVSTWGHDVQKVFQGKKALECAVNNRPDIILLDMMLPEMNGFEVCRALKENCQTSSIYVIILTRFAELERMVQGLKVAADNYIAKPVHYIELKYIIDLGLRKKQRRDDMKSQQRICENFLKIMKIQKRELYQQALERCEICEQVGRFFALPQAQLKRLLTAACLCDIGKVFGNVSPGGHQLVGEMVVSPLKIGKWLRFYIHYHHERLNSPNFPQFLSTGLDFRQELQILITVVRYLELYHVKRDKDCSLALLAKEAQQGAWDKSVVAALLQLRQDETFMQ